MNTVEKINKEITKSNKKLSNCSLKKCIKKYDEFYEIKEECDKAKPNKKIACYNKLMKSTDSINKCDKKECPVEHKEVKANLDKIFKIMDANDKRKSKSKSKSN